MILNFPFLLDLIQCECISPIVMKKNCRLKQLLLPIVTQWVKRAWEYMDPAIIMPLPNQCSISNDFDVMKDDVLWDEQYDKSDADSNGKEM